MQPPKSYSIGGQRSSQAAYRQARRRLDRLQGSLVRGIKHRSTDHNSSLMMSESEFESEQDTIFTREKTSKGNHKNRLHRDPLHCASSMSQQNLQNIAEQAGSFRWAGAAALPQLGVTLGLHEGEASVSIGLSGLGDLGPGPGDCGAEREAVVLSCSVVLERIYDIQPIEPHKVWGVAHITASQMSLTDAPWNKAHKVAMLVE
ncbi:UNVERIFIED_CONTAM: hypothetical protein FKN15_065455 [Acipenser sinensis]